MEDKGFSAERPTTFEDLDRIVRNAKRLLRWEESNAHQDEALISISVGETPERIEVDAASSRTFSGFFCSFSLPTMTYALQFQKDLHRLLHLSMHEVRAFKWLLGWCRTKLVDEESIYKGLKGLTFQEWTFIWSVSITLHIHDFNKFVECTRLIRHGKGDILPSHHAIQYLTDHSHDTPKDVLWNEFARAYAVESNSLYDRKPGIFPIGFRATVDFFRETEGHYQRGMPERRKEDAAKVTVRESEIPENSGMPERRKDEEPSVTVTETETPTETPEISPTRTIFETENDLPNITVTMDD